MITIVLNAAMCSSATLTDVRCAELVEVAAETDMCIVIMYIYEPFPRSETSNVT